MPLPTGPFLLAGVREGSRATLAVVAEVGPEGLRPLPPEGERPGYRERFRSLLLAPGREFVLFAAGARVGRLTATNSGVDERYCPSRPTVSGVVELVPDATGIERFLGLPAHAAVGRPWEPYRARSHDYDMRVASLELAGEAMSLVEAPRPPSVLEARADIQAFRPAGAARPSLAATFLFEDRLTIEAPSRRAYALFLVGTPAPEGYELAYVRYRRASDGGKAAPRYRDHLDWDGDGADELLLDVFGAERRWFAAIERAGEQWVASFEDGCGAD